MDQAPLRVALVGCGQIADAHLQEVPKTRLAAVVAVCDQQIDLARQAAARFEVPAAFDDLGRMLAAVRPDVVHITTPPHTHRTIAIRALQAGAHVYIEKPFTVDVDEADEVLAAAEAAGRLACVGHDQLFDPAWEECRRLHYRGALGRVVHVESVMGYDLGGPFGRIFTSEPEHWIHRLPGGLAHNNISHALSKITDFLADERPRVRAYWFGGAGADDRPVELRAMLQGAEVTASLVFTTAARPVRRVARILGTKMSIEVDLEGRVLRRTHALRAPGPFAKIEAPARQLGEAARSLASSLGKFLRHEIQYFAGMNRLFGLFYRSIQRGTEPPIPAGEIRRVTALMDEIFRRCRLDGEAADLPQGAGAACRCGGTRLEDLAATDPVGLRSDPG